MLFRRPRERYWAEAQQEIEKRNIIWCSAKATDARPLIGIGKSTSVVSVIGSGSELGAEINSFSLEDRWNRRLDYDRFTWDALDPPEAAEFTGFVQKVGQTGPSILVPFASTQFLSNMPLACPDVMLAGNPFLLEQLLNYKPWVEHELSARGVPMTPWKHHIPGSGAINAGCTSLLRSPLSTGGLGHRLSTNDADDIQAFSTASDIISTCRYINHHCSINASACLFRSGRLTHHPISLQIIGNRECTDRTFGYCGNDFGVAPSILDEKDLTQIDTIIRRVGSFLHERGYIGAFGVDLLKTDTGVIMSELNPRFQASSWIGCNLMYKARCSDIFVDHIAAHLGYDPGVDRPSLGDLFTFYTPLAQIFCYRSTVSNIPMPCTSGSDSSYIVDLRPRAKSIDHHGLLFRLITTFNVLENGREIAVSAEQLLRRIKGILSPG